MNFNPADHAALLDQKHLNRLATKPAGCHEVIEAFITAAESILEGLEYTLQKKDEISFEQYRHALAGAALSAGAKALAETCQILAHTQVMTERVSILNTLKEQFRQTREVLLVILSALPDSAAENSLVAHPSTAKIILIVEDNATTRLALETELSERYHLLITDNSVAALALCEQTPEPHAAIVDLNLGLSVAPQSSGLDLIRYLKGKIPALVLTVDEQPDTVTAAQQAGAWAFLSKSVSFALLHANLDIMIARFAEANTRASHNRLDIALGLLMAQHHLTLEEAQYLIRSTAMEQRRRIPEIAQDILNAHALNSSLRKMAHRTDSEPTWSHP